ncbi:hypothetical protein KY330_01265 [Candidatus Woesearchaeota archaeon]|nr:hypothetical protein [Candidatus Woesearchaeota archaeon]
MEFPSLDEIVEDIKELHLPEHRTIGKKRDSETWEESFDRQFLGIIEETYNRIKMNSEFYMIPQKPYDGKCTHTKSYILQVQMARERHLHGFEDDAFFAARGWVVRTVYCRMCPENKLCKWNPKKELESHKHSRSAAHCEEKFFKDHPEYSFSG